MKLSHSRKKNVNREAVLRRPTAVGSSALLACIVGFLISSICQDVVIYLYGTLLQSQRRAISRLQEQLSHMQSISTHQYNESGQLTPSSLPVQKPISQYAPEAQQPDASLFPQLPQPAQSVLCRWQYTGLASQEKMVENPYMQMQANVES